MHMKSNNPFSFSKNTATVTLEGTRFLVTVTNESGEFVRKESFSFWGGKRLSNFLLFNDVVRVRYNDQETRKAAGVF